MGLWKPQNLESPQALQLESSLVDCTFPDQLSFPCNTLPLCLHSLESSWPSAPWISKGKCDRAAERSRRLVCPQGCSRALSKQPPSPWHSISLHSLCAYGAKLCPLYKHTCSVRPSQRIFQLSSSSSFSHMRDESPRGALPALALPTCPSRLPLLCLHCRASQLLSSGPQGKHSLWGIRARCREGKCSRLP